MIVASLVLILGAVTLLVLGLASSSSVLLVLSIAASLFAAVALVVGARQAAAARAQASYTDERFRRAGDEDDSRVFHHRSTVRGNEPGRRRATAWGADETSVAVADPVAPPSVPNQGAYRSGEGTEYGRRRAAAATVDEPGGLVDDRTGQYDEGFADLRADGPPPGQGWPGQQQAPPRQTYAAPDPADDDDDDDDDPPDEPAAQFVSAADAARVARMSAPVLVCDGRPRYHIMGCVHLLGRESEPLPVSEAAELGFTPCSLCEPDSALLAGARRV
ncbi:hypothetical protein SAMN05421812_108231 [Asanoa hainanensis]|uniref:Uncharacterized protein n=1 Tax=Asanoa hainanensis TaxID=560556 RepID=A0A239NEP3_9ACTN|nr:hypothetical protein SAMN05421812_108231 [Asanoa hainanensis]